MASWAGLRGAIGYRGSFTTKPTSTFSLTVQGPYRAVGQALEVIPRTLAQNCGANVIRTLTKLRAKHAEAPDCTFGIDGA